MTVSSYRETDVDLAVVLRGQEGAVSESICWLIVSIIPMAMSLWMRSDPFRFIFLARSATVMPSVMEISLGTGLAMMTVFFFTCRYFSSG